MFGLGALLQAVVLLGRVAWGSIFFPRGHGGAALQPKVLKTYTFCRGASRGWLVVHTAGSDLASRAPYGNRSVMTA